MITQMGSHPYLPFYATQNIMEAEAIKHLEVYTEKIRVQMEKERKHPLLEITKNNTYILGCQYEKLNKYYSAIELVPVTGTFREYPELTVISDTCVSTCKAAIQQSSGFIIATKCLCKGNCSKNYCKYKKASTTCSTRCYPNN
ncbi:17935_t:CDS:2, partial [Gigaspora margarita]